MVAKAHPPSSSESDDWGDEGWIVDCPCGINYDDGEKMVECDECGVWVHTACCRVVKDQETFNCDKCKSKKRKEVEESEVAQLLVDLPSKTLSFEERGHDKSAVGQVDPVRSPVATSLDDRAHVHGVPGGDPRLFLTGSIFSQQLWKYAGYVRKPLRIDFDDLPVNSGEHDILQLLDDPTTDELAVVVTLDSGRLEQSKGEARPSLDGPPRETQDGDLVDTKDRTSKTDVKKGEKPGKHKLKLKLKHKHKSHKEDKLRHHEKRPRDDAGCLQDSASKKKHKSSGGDAVKSGDERSRKVEGLSRNANASPTNMEGSVRGVKASTKKGEGSPRAATSKRDGPLLDTVVSFKSPQSSPKNPKTMKKLAVQEFMDGRVAICSRCCKEETVLGRSLTVSGGKSEPTGCKECGKDLEKVVKLSSTGADARSSPGPLTGYKETESVPPPSATEASPEGKQSSSSEGVMARGTGDRKIDAESPKIDHSHRPLTSHVKYLESNAKRHGGLRPLERAEARVGNLGPGAPEQHLSAVKAAVLSEGKSPGSSRTKDAGGKIVRSDKEQKMSSPDIPECIASSGEEMSIAAGVPKSGRHLPKSATAEGLPHSQNRQSSSIRPVRVNDDLDLKAGYKAILQHSESGMSEPENLVPFPASTSPPVTGGRSGDASQEFVAGGGDGFAKHTYVDAGLGRAVSPGNEVLTGAVSSEAVVQKKPVYASSESACENESPKVPLLFSNADGGDARTLCQLAAGSREKTVERLAANRVKAISSYQDSAQAAQLSKTSQEGPHKATQSVGPENSLCSPRTGTNEELMLPGTQCQTSLHQTGGLSKHVSSLKQAQKHQDVNNSVPRVEIEHYKVSRQSAAGDQAEVAEGLASPGQRRNSEQGSGMDVLDHKVSPLPSPLCQQARQHHLHTSRARPGSSSSSALASSGSHRNPGSAPSGAIKSTTPGGSRSSGGSSSVSPKSPSVSQFSKHGGGSKSNPISPPPQRQSSALAAKASLTASKQSPSPASNHKHQSSGGKQSLLSSSSLPLKTASSSKQPSRTNSLPSLKGAENSLPPKSPGAAMSPAIRGSNLGLPSTVSSTKQSPKIVSSGKHSGTPRNVVGSKASHPQTPGKQLTSLSSGRPNLCSPSESSKSGSLLVGKQSVPNAAKQGSAGNMTKEDKAGSGSKVISTMPPPAAPGLSKRSPPAGPASTLKDEEVAMLLHQELNSSPRVPRVPRARLNISGMQGISSTQTLVAPAKRLTSSASAQGLLRDQASRKRLRDDRHRELGRSSSSVSDESSKAGNVRKHEDGSRIEDGHNISSGSGEMGNLKEKSPHLESSRRPSHGFPKSGLSIVVPAGSDDSSDHGDKKSPLDGTILTLPGLIDDILSNRGHQQLEYEDVCEAVLPYWQKLRKPNGERYAYASHRQAVLDCLRNRSSWSHLVDRGPKTNLGRKKRRTDVTVTTESDEDDDGGGTEHVFADDSEPVRGGRRANQSENEKVNSDHVERSRVVNVALPEDVPKGKRKARSRRRRPMATEDGKSQRNGSFSRTKVGSGVSRSKFDKVVASGLEEEVDAPSSPSSEDAVSNYSEEDEEMVVHKGMRSIRRRRDGESSDGEQEVY